MKQFCIVIPIYKDNLDYIEEISLKRLWEVCGEKNYDVFFIGPSPEATIIGKYKELYPTASFIGFDPKFFKSTATYSQLCCSYEFYNSFSDYEYMQIYQLDAYIRYDEISDWCSKGYDYVGAPIVSQHCGWSNVPRIGNGGVSLRKIETFKYLTDPNGEFIKMYPKLLGNDKIEWEDKHFCIDVNDKYDLEFCSIQEGFNYCCDMNPDLLFDKEYYGMELPMFLHAIDKNIRYWKDKIPGMERQEVIDFCEEKHKDFFDLYYWKHDGGYCTIENA